MSSENMEGNAARPRGRDEVRAALIAAANELFGQKGPDAVSVREVAREADVNHALLHRHFGTKEQLIRDVMKDHAEGFLQAASDARNSSQAAAAMLHMTASRPAFVRIVAYLLLSGHEPAEFASRSGGVAKLVELVAAEQATFDEDSAAMVAAIGTAFWMGWVLFSSFVLYGADFEGDATRADAMAERLILDFMAQPDRWMQAPVADDAG